MVTTAKKRQKSLVAAEQNREPITFHLYSSDVRRICDTLDCCASREEMRYYLNGVYLESGDDGLIAVATDGHRLGRLVLQPIESTEDKTGKTAWKYRDQSLTERFAVIIPNCFVERLASFETDFDIGASTITIADSWIHLKGMPEGFSAKLINGTFLNWRKVMPKETTEQEACAAFDGKYLADIGTALSQGQRPLTCYTG